MHRSLAISLMFIATLFMVGKPGSSMAGVTDTLSKGQSLAGSQTLTSKDRRFELGFFPPNNQIHDRFYLSIRFTQFEEKTVVWTANREKPLIDTAGSSLEIADNGNLEVYHDSVSGFLWSTLTSPASVGNIVAVLGNSGNLILRDDGRQGLILWRSFDHPTDTWMPSATLGSDKSKGIVQRLVSWRSGGDPSPGMFTAEISESREMVLKLNGSVKYWESGPYRYGQYDSALQLSSLFSFENDQSLARLDNNNIAFKSDGSSPSNPAVFSMIVMDHQTGSLIMKTSSRSSQLRWDIIPLTANFGFCGAFGILDVSSTSSTPCRCLQGFAPVPGRKNVDWSCYRESPLDCNRFGFVEISEIKLPERATSAASAANHNDCKSACLNACSCTAYAFNESGCFIWEGDLLRLQYDSSNNQKLQLKLPKGKNKVDLKVIVGVVVPALVLLSCGFLGFFYNRRAKQEEVNKEPGEDLLCFDFNLGFSSADDRTTTSSKEFDLPMFSYESVSASTNNFAPENKLGEGGFGPVYKGTLLNGQEIALKRLSQKSGQGFEEFRNEILLIAKLQHRNLVRLLGCCINHDESILIYEYMPNKSLDFFLFGTDKQEILDWKTRINIVEGIAQGLLYLHEHSRVRIIHRDLKASNILLDEEMNPKISDFGMARIFGGNDSSAHTNKIVGTFGYIAPEYAMEGLFSTKSDVYSFGVLLLEIISGRKNTGCYKSDSLNLLGHAWDLWISDRGVELVDDKVGSPAGATASRYINVGLLCVQGNPNDRPSMSSVVSMVRSEIATLPQPQKPAFSTASEISSMKNSSGESGDTYPSINGLTVSVMEPR